VESPAPRIAVTNTTPLIGLAAVDALFLLDNLFERVIVPRMVWEELNGEPGAREPGLLATLKRREFDPIAYPIPPGAAQLDRSEQAAIAVAVAIQPTRILLDEHAARAVARALGLKVVGTVGVLIEARHLGLIEALRPRLERLQRRGFWLEPAIVEAALAAVGER
jgi:predicted nucleic acid-binding protein